MNVEERALALNEMYETLFANGTVKNKADMAKKVGVTSSSLSAAMNGNPTYCTENLLRKVKKAFPGDLANAINGVAIIAHKGSVVEQPDALRLALEQNGKLIEQNTELIAIIKKLTSAK